MKTTFASLALVAVLSLVADAYAGAVGGPKGTTDTVPAYGTVEYCVVFEGHRQVEVGLIGDGDTDLDLYVYDEYGNLVASDADATDTCYATWHPWRTGRFTIRVVNLGSVYNRFAILTN